MKRILCLLVAVVMVFSLTLVGCGTKQVEPAKESAKEAAKESAKEEKKAEQPKFDPAKYPVAIAMVVKNHPVHRIVQLGFLETAKKLGYPGEVVGIENADWPAYYAAGEAAVAKGVKGMLLWVDPPHAAWVKKISDSGCKVVIPHFKFPDNTPGLDANLAASSVDYGKAVGTLMAEKLKGKKGSVAITQNMSNETENAASKAFAEEMKAKAPDIKVLPVVLEGPELTEAINKISAIIQKNPDLIGAFGTTGGSPASWSGAMDKTGKKDLLVVGMDYTEQSIDLVNKDKIFAIVAQPLYDEASMSMELLDKIFRGEKVPAFTPLEAPIAYKGGSGKSDINYYADIVKRVKEWFK